MIKYGYARDGERQDVLIACDVCTRELKFSEENPIPCVWEFKGGRHYCNECSPVVHERENALRALEECYPLAFAWAIEYGKHIGRNVLHPDHTRLLRNAEKALEPRTSPDKLRAARDILSKVLKGQNIP